MSVISEELLSLLLVCLSHLEDNNGRTVGKITSCEDNNLVTLLIIYVLKSNSND
nr:hypothetical protein [Mycoplasmopsis bovis]